MALMQHGQLAVVHALESWRGAPVLVLEYLAGGTLADRIRQGSLPISDVVAIGTAMCDALRHVHNSGYLHRDVKPSNVVFTSHGTSMLLDFALMQTGVAITVIPCVIVYLVLQKYYVAGLLNGALK